MDRERPERQRHEQREEARTYESDHDRARWAGLPAENSHDHFAAAGPSRIPSSQPSSMQSAHVMSSQGPYVSNRSPDSRTPTQSLHSSEYPPLQGQGVAFDARDELQSLRTGPQAPPPVLADVPLRDVNSRRFQFTVRQQPQQGRLCGLGSKDKRPLDPLPILQLRILNEEGSEDHEAENSPNLMVHVSLRKVDPATNQHSDAVLTESNDPAFPWTRMLEGRLVASANVARDLDGSKACFFVFTDLSIRQEGQFRLLFKLFVIGPPAAGMPASDEGGGRLVAEALTGPFTVYSPRRFPGMTESTELAKCLARQGIQVPIRNDVRRRPEQSDSTSTLNEDQRT